MLNKKIRIFSLLVLLLLFLPFVCADSIPIFMMVEGAVTVYEMDAVPTTTIKAYIEGDSDPLVADGATIVTTAGQYLMVITGDFLDLYKPITFKVNDIQVNESIILLSMGPFELNLSVDCTDGDGDGYSANGFGCGPVDCDDNNTNINPGAADVCNVIDDDCNPATVDGSGETAPDNSKQDGVCSGSKQSCDGGSWVDDYSPVTNYEEPETSCDGLDNDCDGPADEELTGPLNSKQDGVCDGSVQSCTGVGGWADDYSGIGGYEEPEASCDGLNNDCDGEVDNGFPDNDNDKVGCNYDDSPLYCGADCVDEDDDNDGVLDGEDSYPFDDERWILGDINGDDEVNILDLILTRRQFGKTPGDPDWNDYYDLNDDGAINILDLILVRRNFT